MGVLSLVLYAILVAVVIVAALYFFGVFERGVDKGLSHFNRTLTKPTQKARKVQVPGRDHVCEFGPGSIFCIKCGRLETGD